ncbi:2-hydroxyacid dehydrogenase [Bradyrhizobium sp. CW7]|uniref:2-hydroxyacid dehydrogenase n=1 Tax=Bradyrhizobium sp. CW7 TaxID=2782688 RepID=UPI001FFC11B2|nr:2-hydroxyacid dehydrogenase [Bradyrhizobium sp. CW7]MCK1356242.1 2-hydroxyacid dehydrogenase [Bradyrhizobium sp. CW7]
MTRPAVAVIAAIPSDLRDALQQSYELLELPQPSQQAAVAGVSCAIAVTTSMAGADAALMDRWPGLRLIACQGAGLDRIDLQAARQRGIAVCHTPDVLTEDTADFAIGLMYAVARRIVEADRFVRAGRWQQERMAPSSRVFGKRMGVIGLGKIGQAIARRAIGLGMEVMYSGPRPKPEISYTFVGKPEPLAAAVDVLILSCPGGPATHHLVDARILRELGSKGFLINVARGSVVDEAALIEALGGGVIAGAGLDVFASEPAIDERFLRLDNVVLQPHYASITHEARKAIIERLQNDIVAFLTARPFHDAARARGGSHAPQ